MSRNTDKLHYICLGYRDPQEIMDADLSKVPADKMYDILQSIEDKIEDGKVDINKIKPELICILHRFMWAARIVRKVHETDNEYALDAVLNKMFENAVEKDYILNPNIDNEGRCWEHGRMNTTFRKLRDELGYKKNAPYIPIVIEADPKNLYKADNKQQRTACFKLNHQDFIKNSQEEIDRVLEFCIETADSIVTMMSFLNEQDSIDEYVNSIKKFNLEGKSEEEIQKFIDGGFEKACKGYMAKVQDSGLELFQYGVE